MERAELINRVKIKRELERRAESSPSEEQDSPVASFEAKAREPEDMLRVAAEGAGQGFTRNLGDNASALLGAAFSTPVDEEINRGFWDRYEANKAERDKQIAEARAIDPKLFDSFQMWATLPLAVASGGSTIGGQALAAGADLAVSSLGASDSLDEESLKNAAKEAAIGYGSTAGLGLAGAGLGTAVRTLAPKAKSAAEWLAVRALGRKNSVINNLVEKGDINELGRKLLDDEIVTPFASEKQLRERTQDALSNAQKGVSSVLDDPRLKEAAINSNELRGNLRTSIDDIAGAGNYGMSSQGDYLTDYVDRELVGQAPGLRDVYKGLGSEGLDVMDQPIPLRELVGMRRGVDKSISNWSGVPEGPGRQAALRRLRSAVEGQERGVIKNAADDLLEPYTKAKRESNLLYSATDLVEDQEARAIRNNLAGLPEVIIGGTTAAGTLANSSDPASDLLKVGGLGLLGAAGSRVVRGRGYQFAAGASDAASRALAKAGGALNGKTGAYIYKTVFLPQAIQQITQEAPRDPEQWALNLKSIFDTAPDEIKTEIGTGVLRQPLGAIIKNIPPEMHSEVLKNIKNSVLSSTEKAKILQELQKAIGQ